MKKRIVLGVLMLVVGLATATSVEGLVIGLPLVGIGLYVSVPTQFRSRMRSAPVRSTR